MACAKMISSLGRSLGFKVRDPINHLEFKENGYSARDTLKQVMLLMQGRFYRRERERGFVQIQLHVDTLYIEGTLVV